MNKYTRYCTNTDHINLLAKQGPEPNSNSVLTDSLLEEVEDDWPVGPPVAVLGLDEHVVHGARPQVPQHVEGVRGEAPLGGRLLGVGIAEGGGGGAVQGG